MNYNVARRKVVALKRQDELLQSTLRSDGDGMTAEPADTATQADWVSEIAGLLKSLDVQPVSADDVASTVTRGISSRTHTKY